MKKFVKTITLQEEIAERNVFLLKRKVNNNGVVCPHDVVKCVLPLVRSLHTFLQTLNIEARTYDAYRAILKTYALGADVDFIVQQWQKLPNYLANHKVLPVVDVSESMEDSVGGMNAMEVAVSLGLYCADKHNSAFKNVFFKFTQNCDVDKLVGNVWNNAFQMVRTNSFDTIDLHKLFDRLFNVARANNVRAPELPDTVLVLSNKKLDECVNYNEHAFNMVTARYEHAGYSMPKVVFWNLSEQRKVTVQRERGTTLISGFTMAVLMNVLSNNMQAIAN